MTCLPLRHSAISLALIVLLTGCAVGPDHQRPQLPETKGYSPGILPEVMPAADQRILPGRDIQADWWTLFESKELNALIEKALAAHPTIEAAQASLQAAQANVLAQRGFFSPTVGAGYQRTRTKIAANLGGNSPGLQGDGSVISTGESETEPFATPVIYNFHTAQLTVGYNLDVFGGLRREGESLEALAEVEYMQLQAARITLATNIVAAAIEGASLRRQLQLTQETITANEALVELARRQHKAGYASRLDYVVQENALAQARQTLPPLQRQFEQNRNLLRQLAGNPQDADVHLFELDALRLPQELPLSLPSQLIEQRPDVRAAEAQLHAATAQVGVARAARLPQFNIAANWGGAASHFSQMFWSSGKFFEIGATIAGTLFEGGTLRYREKSAQATMRQAAAQYKTTVLTAYQNVADALQAVHADAKALEAAAHAEGTSREAMNLTRRQHQRGYLDRLALIKAEQDWRQARLALTQAQAVRLGDAATLFQALGGGWWQRPAEADSMLASKPSVSD